MQQCFVCAASVVVAIFFFWPLKGSVTAIKCLNGRLKSILSEKVKQSKDHTVNRLLVLLFDYFVVVFRSATLYFVSAIYGQM